MSLFDQLTVHRPGPSCLQIDRQPGWCFWVFTGLFGGFSVGLNLLFAAMFFDLEAPSTLTCRSQQQRVNCEYVTSGPLSGKTVESQDVRSAIASQKPNGEVIVLTSSQPWIVLQATDNNTRNIQQINQAIAQLRQNDQTVQVPLQPPQGSGLSVILFFGPIGLLFLSLSLALLLGEGPVRFEFDADRNLITVTRLGFWRSRLAAFNTLLGADRKPAGYLGWLSDRLGVYLQNGDNGDWGSEIVRLRLVNRRPIRLLKTSRFGQAETLVERINTFIADQSLQLP